MNFDDMKKVWDKQENQVLYVVNEKAMHEQVLKKKTKTGYMASAVEWALFTLNVLVGGFLLHRSIMAEKDWMSFVIPVFMLLSAAYLMKSRYDRRRRESSFDSTMLGDLENAIENAGYLVLLSRKVLYWYNLPIVTFGLLNVAMNSGNPWSIAILFGALVLAHFLGRWEIQRCHIPRKERLLELRNKLVSEPVAI